ncbi:MAG: response regulator [Chloroflexi bacterium]|nr:response regulator [Chloroflexota bacterium]
MPILIVDDSAVMVRLLEYTLRSVGYATQAALSGDAALERIREQRPALVFLDIMMPDVDGLQVLRRIRRDPALAELPVVVISARAQEADRDAALAAGATDYMTKPYSRDQVLAFAARYGGKPGVSTP